LRANFKKLYDSPHPRRRSTLFGFSKKKQKVTLCDQKLLTSDNNTLSCRYGT
jgi:hypothetical protein